MARVPVGRLLAVAVVVLLLARYVGGVDWGARAAVAVVLGYAVFRLGTGTLLPLRVGPEAQPPVDVVGSGGLPVYSCRTCGTQLVLLRKGSDRAPRHCGEAMTFTVVTEEDADPAPGVL